MKFFNMDMLVVETVEWASASLEEKGIWLELQIYCSKIENNGIIAGVGGWSDAACRTLLKCGKEQLESGSPLWRVRPDGALIVEHYNIQAQEFARERRQMARSRSAQKGMAARENGKLGGRPQKFISFPQEGTA